MIIEMMIIYFNNDKINPIKKNCLKTFLDNIPRVTSEGYFWYKVCIT